MKKYDVQFLMDEERSETIANCLKETIKSLNFNPYNEHTADERLQCPNS